MVRSPLGTGFVLNRINHLQEFATVIEEILARGHRAVLLCCREESEKGYGRISEEALNIFRNGKPEIRWFSWSNLASAATEAGIDVLAFIDGLDCPATQGCLDQFQQLRYAGVRIVSIPHYFETVHRPLDDLSFFDRVCYQSEFSRRLHLEHHGAPVTDEDQAKMTITGSPYLDHFDGLDRDTLRRKYGIAPGRRVVLFMSLKLNVPEPWRRCAFALPKARGFIQALSERRPDLLRDVLFGVKYEEMMRSMKVFCDRNRAALVVKSRRKHDDPDYVRTLADHFYFDESFYPGTSIELLAIADLCIHFQSGTVIEAVASRVPSIAVVIPQDHLVSVLSPNLHAHFFPVLDGKTSMQDFPGIVYALDVKKFCRKMESSRLEDFAFMESRRAEYVGKYLDYADPGSGKRVAAVIEEVAESVFRSRQV